MFPSPVGRLGIQDAVLNGFRRVAFPQGFKPDGAPGTRKDQRRVFPVKPESIALFLQRPQELFPCEGSGDGSIDVLPDGCFPCGVSVLLGKPLGIRAGYPFRFLGMDDGEMMLLHCSSEIRRTPVT